jgi:hypothetical protein
MISQKGLGEYPGYYCYDAQRPSWLPYWLDDITESGCKWNPKTIAGNLSACLTNDPSCNAPSGSQLDPNKSGPGVAGPGEPVNVPTCSGWFQQLDIATNTCTLALPNTTLLLIGALGILLLTSIGGRRR